MGIFSVLWQSYNKSQKLAKISKVLGAGFTDRSAADSIDAMFSEHPSSNTKPGAEEELFNLCKSNPGLSTVMKKHNANRETLRYVYSKLLEAGAGQWVNGHYVAASALAFGMTLDYILKNQTNEAEFDKVAMRVVDYFARGENGIIV